MNMTGWLITIGSWIPPLVIVIGSIIFAVRAKSCSAVGLVLGAIGQFVMAVVLPLYSRFGIQELLASGNADFITPLTITLNSLSIFAGLLFAVFLLVVLLGKARAKGAVTALKPQPGPQPYPVPTQAPPPPQPVSTQVPPPPPSPTA